MTPLPGQIPSGEARTVLCNSTEETPFHKRKTNEQHKTSNLETKARVGEAYFPLTG
jgi:hypothetical protein